MGIKLFLLAWSPVLMWAGLIFGLSHIPSLNSGLGVWDFILRKIAHLAEYAVLAALFLRAFSRTWPLAATRKILLWSVILSILYAISDEYHQSFVPGRGPSGMDVLIDSVGAFLFAVSYAFDFLRVRFWTQRWIQ